MTTGALLKQGLTLYFTNCVSSHLTRLGFLVRRCNFLRDNIPCVTTPVHEEVPDVLVVGLPLVMHLGLYRRGGLTPAQLAVEGLTLKI